MCKTLYIYVNKLLITISFAGFNKLNHKIKVPALFKMPTLFNCWFVNTAKESQVTGSSGTMAYYVMVCCEGEWSGGGIRGKKGLGTLFVKRYSYRWISVFSSEYEPRILALYHICIW